MNYLLVRDIFRENYVSPPPSREWGGKVSVAHFMIAMKF